MHAIFLPALRGEIGDWIYYSTLLRLEDVAQRVRFAEEIHTSSGLKDMIQRSIDESTHSRAISEYLVRHEQRFFNSLVIGVYGGSPQWYPISITEIQVPDLEGLHKSNIELEEKVGILMLSGEENLFAIDGQHRVSGIRKALRKTKEIREEEVSALFISHRATPEGLVRTRRLFTRLNRYAKPVSEFEKIALDEDDTVAIITRVMLEEHPLLKNKVSLKKNKSIAQTDRVNFTSIVTIYQVFDIFMRDKRPADWREFKGMRPQDNVINSYKEKCDLLLTTMIRYFPEVEDLFESEADQYIPGKYRGAQGGHLLYRPIGLLIFIKALKEFLDKDWTIEKAVESISKVNMQLSGLPWAGLLWSNESKQMITAPHNQSIAKMLLIFLAGDKKWIRKVNNLARDYYAILGQEIPENGLESLRELMPQ